MPTARSYKITVDYTVLNEQNAKTTSALHLAATAADLAVLLQALDASPTVAGFSVYSTVTVPNLQSLGKLTAGDLGMMDLKKLK
jgi:hypothetical protein